MMRHLVPLFLAALIAGGCLALLVRAAHTSADSFVIVALLGFVGFTWFCIAEVRACWPDFITELRRRRNSRPRPLDSSDTH